MIVVSWKRVYRRSALAHVTTKVVYKRALDLSMRYLLNPGHQFQY